MSVAHKWLTKRLPSRKGRESRGYWSAGVPARSKFSRAIDFDRLDLAAVTMDVDGDWTTTNFAILDRGKGAD